MLIGIKERDTRVVTLNPTVALTIVE